MLPITASIVLYNHEVSEVSPAIASFLGSGRASRLYLVDNSENDALKKLATDDRIIYIYNGCNLGYGKAHNKALNSILNESKYHVILNPDVEFDSGILDALYDLMEDHEDVGQVMPKILYIDGSLQKLCKLLPTPFDLIGRRFFGKNKWAKRLNDRYELGGFKYDKTVELPNLSGCFMFLRVATLRSAGVFDERYFMYLEDVDLTRRVHKLAKTIFYPGVHVYHGYQKESYSNPALLKFHVRSAVSYFNKWGWFWDSERKRINKQTLQQISSD